VINEGVDTIFFKKKNIEKENIIFFPAYYWPHKNHDFIISAFENLIFKLNINCRLIMCGGFPNKLSFKKNEINKKYNNKILHLGLIKKTAIRQLYQKSKIVISASTYESSSLPILEAIACGTNVLASNIQPNKELSKKLDFEIYDLNNFNSFIKKFIKIWNDNKYQNYLIKKNKKKILKFNWIYFAKEIYAIAGKI
jgi:glycosyltransferase involved in cell wall biosynthesis